MIETQMGELVVDQHVELRGTQRVDRPSGDHHLRERSVHAVGDVGVGRQDHDLVVAPESVFAEVWLDLQASETSAGSSPPDPAGHCRSGSQGSGDPAADIAEWHQGAREAAARVGQRADIERAEDRRRREQDQSGFDDDRAADEAEERQLTLLGRWKSSSDRSRQSGEGGERQPSQDQREDHQRDRPMALTIRRSWLMSASSSCSTNVASAAGRSAVSPSTCSMRLAVNSSRVCRGW